MGEEEGEACVSPARTRPKLRIRFGVYVLGKEGDLRPTPKETPATRVCTLGGTADEEGHMRLKGGCLSVTGETGTIPGALAKLSAGLNHTSPRQRECFCFFSRRRCQTGAGPRVVEEKRKEANL